MHPSRPDEDLYRALVHLPAFAEATEMQAQVLDRLAGATTPLAGRSRSWSRRNASWVRWELAAPGSLKRNQRIDMGDSWALGASESIPQLMPEIHARLEAAMTEGRLIRNNLKVDTLDGWRGPGIALTLEFVPGAQGSSERDEYGDVAFDVIEPHRYAVHHFGEWSEGGYTNVDTIPFYELVAD